jgi:hypothetical protein
MRWVIIKGGSPQRRKGRKVKQKTINKDHIDLAKTGSPSELQCRVHGSPALAGMTMAFYLNPFLASFAVRCFFIIGFRCTLSVSGAGDRI